MKYDGIVIGAGQAAKPLSLALAEQGWKMALIEKAHLGGTCINTGCTPTKTMVASAQVAHYVRRAHRWGVRAGGFGVSMTDVVERKRAVVESFRSGIEKAVQKSENLRLYRGVGRFLDSQHVEVGGEVLEAEKMFIDTGSHPLVPPIEGLKDVGFLDNESIMELSELPEHLVVLGGGYIGLEFGQMFLRFGSRVTVIQRADRILPREDEDVSEALQNALAKEGMEFRLSADAKRVRKKNKDISVELAANGGSETVTGSHLLVATGRMPNTNGLGLEEAGVETDAQGFIKVNDRLETSVPGIWAFGDVKGGPAFTHISYNDFEIVYGNLIEGKNLNIRDRVVPYSVFTDPQVGRVGMTEKEARRSGKSIKVGKILMTHVARAIERDETAGLMKLIVDEEDRILGATMLASEGGELVQIFTALMVARVPYTVLEDVIFIHPTLAEGLYSLVRAVELVE